MRTHTHTPHTVQTPVTPAGTDTHTEREKEWGTHILRQTLTQENTDRQGQSRQQRKYITSPLNSVRIDTNNTFNRLDHILIIFYYSSRETSRVKSFHRCGDKNQMLTVYKATSHVVSWYFLNIFLTTLIAGLYAGHWRNSLQRTVFQVYHYITIKNITYKTHVGLLVILKSRYLHLQKVGQFLCKKPFHIKLCLHLNYFIYILTTE